MTQRVAVLRARFVYEAARLEAEVSSRLIVPEPWHQREEPFKAQFVETIARICVDGYETTPEAEHASWMRAYEAMGWVWGPVRDRATKTHPGLVPYNDLSLAEREKDAVFVDLCRLAVRYIR